MIEVWRGVVYHDLAYCAMDDDGRENVNAMDRLLDLEDYFDWEVGKQI